jgi:sulfide:quinone oxidoreductase
LKQIVILGAGFAGLTLASQLDRLAEEQKAAVTLIDSAPHFQMGLSAQWAFAGRRPPEEGRRPYQALRAKHVRFVNQHVHAIDRAARLVRTREGQYPYDYLVLATGAEYAPELVPGLGEVAHNVCDVAGAVAFRAQLDRLKEGNIVILVASVPFKCPPAPYEYALLVEELLERRGIRTKCRVVVATPEPQPMPSAGKAVGDKLRGMLEALGVECLFQHKVKAIDSKDLAITFENGASLKFAAIGAMPPHRAPKAVREAGLADASGFVPVDLKTLRTSQPGVFAVGDVAALKLPDGKPHPKAGVFAEAQAAAVASTLRAEIEGGQGDPYPARGFCFVEVGRNEAARAEIDLLAEGGPRAQMEAPSKEGLDAKRAFEAERLARWFT